MEWKIGDKVRLTGWKWPNSDRRTFHKGSQHVITGVTGDKVEMAGYTWLFGNGWEIELVERKEEKMVSISDVNVGDRVKLTRENGDESTFTVTDKTTSHLNSLHNTNYVGPKETLEIVERAFKLIPGLYSNHHTNNKVVVLETGEAYFSAATGVWVEGVLNNNLSQTYSAVRQLGDWFREVTF